MSIKFINEIKKYKERGLNISQISRVTGFSRNTIRKHLQTLSSVEEQPKELFKAAWASLIDWEHCLNERSIGTQLAHYWEQNIDGQIDGVTYISFWREFKRRHPSLKLDMHQSFTPGQRAEFDFKGQDPHFGFIDAETGEFTACRLFGMILPASQVFFARATLNEQQDNVFKSVAKGFESFGGTTGTLVFDNAKAQVTKADRFDPDLNSEFSLFCNHYEIAPLAARPKCPKDKSLIENALGVFWRWAGPQLRKKTFFNLSSVNQELALLLKAFNDRTQKKYGMSRTQRFDSFEKQKLKPLPNRSYETGFWKKAKVHPDCHVQVQHNFYSVPYKHRHESLDVRVSGRALEIFSKLERIAIHQLPLNKRGAHYTKKEHLPPAHLAMLEQTPKNALLLALDIGPHIHALANRLIKEAVHPLMYLRRLQGILRLQRRYSREALENAAGFFANASLSDIKVRNLEQVITAQTKIIKPKKIERNENENLRGQNHWAETFH